VAIGGKERKNYLLDDPASELLGQDELSVPLHHPCGVALIVAVVILLAVLVMVMRLVVVVIVGPAAMGMGLVLGGGSGGKLRGGGVETAGRPRRGGGGGGGGLRDLVLRHGDWSGLGKRGFVSPQLCLWLPVEEA
jgi:hypothetical protein